MLSWVYLQQLLGYGRSNTRKVLEKLKNPSGIENASREMLLALGFTENQVKRHGTELLNYCKDVIAKCNENYITIIPYNSPKYPQKLKYIYSPAVVLYSVGRMPDFDKMLSVAVVGPREISEYGSKTAFSLSARLALCGATIVSGGARGGDSYAHQGAMAAGGYTIAVTGGGLLSGYLVKNKFLRHKIIKRGGLLITEFAPDYVPKDKNSFHLRNRILAGISDVCAVVEAGERSGAVITANHTVDQGKDVFVIEGNPSMPQYKGTAKLLEDGATPLKIPADILKKYPRYVDISKIHDITPSKLKELYTLAYNELNWEIPKKTTKKQNKPKVKPVSEEKTDSSEVLDKLYGDSKKVYSVLTDNGMIADEIVLKTGLSTSAVLCALTKLEIMGHIKKAPGSRYCIK